MTQQNQVLASHAHLLTDFRRTADQAQVELANMTALASALHEDGPVPSKLQLHASHAKQSVRFATNCVPLDKRELLCCHLLEVYPPEPAIAQEAARKPLSTMTPYDLQNGFEVSHAVGFRINHPHPSHSAHWWTLLAGDVGLTEIIVDGAYPGDFGLPNAGYESRHTSIPQRTSGSPRERSLATTFVRALKPLSAYPQKRTPLEGWNQAWTEFANEMGGQVNVQQFINAARAATLAKGPLALTDLPGKRLSTHGAEFRAKGEAAVLAQELHEQTNSDRHPWHRLGNFWSLFSNEQATALVELSERQHAALPDMQARQNGLLAEAEQWVTSFMQAYSGIDGHDVIWSSMGQAMARELGNGVRLTSVSSSAGTHQAWLALPGNHLGPNEPESKLMREVVVTADQSKPRLTCLNITPDYM